MSEKNTNICFLLLLQYDVFFSDVIPKSLTIIIMMFLVVVLGTFHQQCLLKPPALCAPRGKEKCFLFLKMILGNYRKAKRSNTVCLTYYFNSRRSFPVWKLNSHCKCEKKTQSFKRMRKECSVFLSHLYDQSRLHLQKEERLHSMVPQ